MPKNKKAKKSNVPKWVEKFEKPFPKRRYVAMKYAYYSEMATATTGVETQNFQINTIYDPDATGIGSQARYFDQLVSTDLYQKFRVHGCKYKVTLQNMSTTKNAQALVIPTSNGTSVANNADVYYARELPRAKWTMLSPLGQSTSKRTISGYQSIWPLISASKESYLADEDNAGTYTSDPTDFAYLQVLTADDPVTGAGSDIHMFVELILYVELFDLSQTVSQS